MSRTPKEPVKLVPVPSTNKIPERDIDKSPFWMSVSWASISAA